MRIINKPAAGLFAGAVCLALLFVSCSESGGDDDYIPPPGPEVPASLQNIASYITGAGVVNYDMGSKTAQINIPNTATSASIAGNITDLSGWTVSLHITGSGPIHTDTISAIKSAFAGASVSYTKEAGVIVQLNRPAWCDNSSVSDVIQNLSPAAVGSVTFDGTDTVTVAIDGWTGAENPTIAGSLAAEGYNVVVNISGAGSIQSATLNAIKNAFAGAGGVSHNLSGVMLPVADMAWGGNTVSVPNAGSVNVTWNDEDPGAFTLSDGAKAALSGSAVTINISNGAKDTIRFRDIETIKEAVLAAGGGVALSSVNIGPPMKYDFRYDDVFGANASVAGAVVSKYKSGLASNGSSLALTSSATLHRVDTLKLTSMSETVQKYYVNVDGVNVVLPNLDIRGDYTYGMGISHTGSGSVTIADDVINSENSLYRGISGAEFVDGLTKIGKTSTLFEIKKVDIYAKSSGGAPNESVNILNNGLSAFLQQYMNNAADRAKLAGLGFMGNETCAAGAAVPYEGNALKTSGNTQISGNFALWLMEKGVPTGEVEIAEPDSAYATSASFADMTGVRFGIRNAYLKGSNWKQVDFHNIPLKGVVTFQHAPKRADNGGNISNLWLVIGNYNEPDDLILSSADVLELSSSVTRNKIKPNSGSYIKNLITPDGNNGTGFVLDSTHNRWKSTPTYELVSNYGYQILQVNKSAWANNVKDATMDDYDSGYIIGNLGNTPPAGNTIN